MNKGSDWVNQTDAFKGRDREGRHPELRSCVKVEVAVVGSPSVIVLMVSVDVKQHVKKKKKKKKDDTRPKSKGS